MKTFYIRYPRDFANEYDLCYCESAEEQAAAEKAGFERITRKEAERKCAAEKWARKNDQAFSGYGSSSILPYSLLAKNAADPYGDITLPEDIGLTLHGYIWE